MINPAVPWLLSLMVSVAPPGRKTYYPEAQETREEALTRYESIATDVVEVVFAPKKKPLFTGKYGRIRTSLVILSIMLHEGGLMKHVDFGLGRHARGDKGRSCTLMQMNLGEEKTRSWNIVHDRLPRPTDPPSEIAKGYTCDEMFADRKLAVAEGYKVISLSFSACSKLPALQRLRAYASGNCEGGARESEARMSTAMKFWDRGKPLLTFTDADIVKLVEEKQKKSEGPLPSKALSVEEDIQIWSERRPFFASVLPKRWIYMH